MRRITWLALSLFLLALFGYFAWLNNQNVSISLFGTFTIQLALWTTMLTCFLLGLLLSELRMLFRHPDRLIMRMRRSFRERSDTRNRQRREEFAEACKLRDPEGAQRMFRKIHGAEEDPNLQVQLLKALEDRLDGRSLLKLYDELREQFPGDLGVLLGNQGVALDQEQWLLAEQIGKEIERVSPGHPAVLEGLVAISANRGDWETCLAQEQRLLKMLNGSHTADRQARQHQQHREQAGLDSSVAMREAS